jgi:hypothetical protein
MGASQGVEPEQDESMPLKPEGAGEGEPEGLLGAQTTIAHSGCRGNGPIMGRTVRSVTGRLWKVIGLG